MAKEFYINIFEGDEPEKLTDATYRVGPYKSYDEAMDMYFTACFHVQPEVDGIPVNWDYDIEEIGEDNEISCAC